MLFKGHCKAHLSVLANFGLFSPKGWRIVGGQTLRGILTPKLIYIFLVGSSMVNRSAVRIQTKHGPNRLECKWMLGEGMMVPLHPFPVYIFSYGGVANLQAVIPFCTQNGGSFSPSAWY